jgi:hypothetical protein
VRKKNKQKKTETMKQLKLVVVAILSATILFSCGNGVEKQPATEDGFAVIEAELKNKFGDDAYYTDLTIMYDESIGNSIATTVTDDPESLKMGQWTYSLGQWRQTSDVSLEIPEGTKAADFMYQLNEKINLKKLGELVEKSKEQLTSDKKIENPSMEQAYVYFPKDGNMEDAEYSVRLEPEHGGTSFRFNYKLDGSLIKMDY